MTASGPSTGSIASGAAKRPRSLLYVFTSVALAVFLGTIMIGRKHSDRFTATAVLMASDNGNLHAPVDEQAVLTSLQKTAHLEQVVDDLRRDELIDQHDLDSAVVRSQLTIDRGPSRTGSGTDFSVTLIADNGSAAMAIVNRMCQRYVHELANRPDEIGVPSYRGDTYAVAARSAEQADAEHQQAKTELERFLDLNLGALEGDLNPSQEPAPLMARYESISLSESSSTSDSSAQGQALVARFQRLKRRVEETRSQQATARRRERQQWEKKFDEPPAIVWQVDPALTARRQFSPIPISRLALAMSLGLVGGGFVVFSRRGGKTLATAEQAEAVLSVPVSGTVAEPDGAGRPAPSRHPWPIRLALSASEWLLCGALLAMILASMMDKHFAEHMRREPLSALADGARCVVEIVWS